jgi:hypothetical protein
VIGRADILLKIGLAFAVFGSKDGLGQEKSGQAGQVKIMVRKN